MNRWGVLAVLLATAAALALRLPELAKRPLHNDEAVNAVKVTELWQHGHYAYDPDEFHGPTLHYATLPFLWLSGARNSNELHDATLRLAPVAFGAGLILLLLLFVDGLCRGAVAWAAVLTAVSPAMVFYSRYFIHEMLLVFFTTLTMGAGWRYCRSRSAGWALTTGLGLGLMFATKETFVLPVAAMAAAGLITLWWTTPGVDVDGVGNGTRTTGWTARMWLLGKFWNWKHLTLAFGAAFTVWLLMFSSLFTNPAGLLDSVRTYLPWLKRAGGESVHIHPWYFYFHRLAWFRPARSPVWSEGLILGLATIGAVVSLAGKKPALHRFLALYTIILTAVYCAISYKTPWCLLGFLEGMILLAGIGAAALVEVCRAPALKIVAVLVLAGLTLQLSFQAWRASFSDKYVADPRNPYAYAQTSPDLLNLVQRIDGIAHVAPAGYETVVKVMAPDSDYWPLPWYLRRFANVGWYDSLPEDPYSPIMVVSTQFKAMLDDKSNRKWIMAEIHELRPGRYFELYVELELWKKYVATLPRPVD